MINIFIFKNQKESSRDFKRRGYLHKWIPENGAMKVSMVKMYSIADVIKLVFFLFEWLKQLTRKWKVISICQHQSQSGLRE